MKNRAERLVEVAERALDVAKDAYSAALAARDRALADVERAKAVVVESLARRDREIARGVTESTFAELDAWMLVAKKHVVVADVALVAAEKFATEARVRVDLGLVRVRQMEKLVERVQKDARKKEDRQELRAADEALARRATTK